MENGFGTNDIITGRGLGIGGFGYDGYMQAGNSMLAADAHANGTGLNARVECNGAAQAAQLDRLSDQNEETRRILQNDEVRKDISDFRLQGAITDGQQNVALADRLCAMSAASAKCCCDTQLLIEKRYSDLAAQAERLDKESVLRDLDNRDRQLQTQTIIAACKCNAVPTCL